jgi:hypothetical protein
MGGLGLHRCLVGTFWGPDKGGGEEETIVLPLGRSEWAGDFESGMKCTGGICIEGISKSKARAFPVCRVQSASGYRGVSTRRDGTSVACLTVRGQDIALGPFDTPEEAAQAYNFTLEKLEACGAVELGRLRNKLPANTPSLSDASSAAALKRLRQFLEPDASEDSDDHSAPAQVRAAPAHAITRAKDYS